MEERPTQDKKIVRIVGLLMEMERKKQGNFREKTYTS